MLTWFYLWKTVSKFLIHWYWVFDIQHIFWRDTVLPTMQVHAGSCIFWGTLVTLKWLLQYHFQNSLHAVWRITHTSHVWYIKVDSASQENSIDLFSPLEWALNIPYNKAPVWVSVVFSYNLSNLFHILAHLLESNIYTAPWAIRIQWVPLSLQSPWIQQLGLQSSPISPFTFVWHTAMCVCVYTYTYTYAYTYIYIHMYISI